MELKQVVEEALKRVKKDLSQYPSGAWSVHNEGYQAALEMVHNNIIRLEDMQPDG